MKIPVSISIAQLENLLEVAKLRKEKEGSNATNIIKIYQKEEGRFVGKADKLEFKLENSRSECNDHYLGTN